MNELEEAIREHLDLKRRRGADPAEVAREEQEALAPVTRSHPIVVAPPPLEREAPAAPSLNGASAQHEHVTGEPDEELDADSTQEFRIDRAGSADDWLEDDDV